MTYPLSIQMAYKFNDTIREFGRTNYTTKLPITDYSHEHENYIIDNDYKYFLNTQKWKELYLIIQKDHMNNLTLNVKDKQEHLKLKGNLKNIIIEELKVLMKKIMPENTNVGPRIKLHEEFNLLKEMVSGQETFYGETIYFNIQDKIFGSILKNKLNDNFAFQISETTACINIAKAIINAYFSIYNLPLIKKHVKTSNYSEEDVTLYEDLWIYIFSIYNTSNNNPTTNDLLNIKNKLYTNFNLDINNKVLINVIARKVLLQGMHLASSESFNLYYIGMQNYITTNNININMLYNIEKALEESLTNVYLSIGSILINHFIDVNIFSLNVKQIIDKTLNTYKTMNFIELNHDLEHDLFLNSGGFKPFLHPNSLDFLKENTLTLYSNNIAINLKFDSMIKPIHVNLTGKGFFNKESIFAISKQVTYVYLAVDKEFLKHYMKLFLHVVNKTYKDFTTDEDKDMLYTFLSVYEIDFNTLRQQVDIQYKAVLDTLIELALNFDNSYIDVLPLILAIKDKPIQKSLKEYYYQISAYKFILHLSLRDMITYSAFNYVIMPSFFDFRGRRYFPGITFNIQSYHMLKAFIKIHEVDESFIDHNNFITLKDGLLSVIKDANTKVELSTLIENQEHYKVAIDNLCKEFIYSHLHSDKFSLQEFDLLYNNITIDFFTLYMRILTVIKKKSKALMIVSFIMLEHQRKTNIVTYANHYSYDMVTSGYQMLALLFRNRNLAELCNLIGDRKHDLYLDLSHQFSNTITYMYNYLNLVITKVLNMNIVEFQIPFSPDVLLKDLTPKELFRYFLLSDIIDEAKFDYILNAIQSDNIISKYLSYFNVDKTIWFIKESFMHKTIVSTILLILRKYYQLHKIILLHPWLLTFKLFGNRLLFKHIVMIQIYGGTRKGRFNAFNNFFKEFSIQHNIIVNLDFLQKKDLFEFIELFYKHYRNINLNETQSVVQLGKLLSMKKNIITIKNPNFTFLYAPILLDTKGKRHNMRSLVDRKPYQLTTNKILWNSLGSLIENNFKIDSKKQTSSFPPNFIHSMDSMCVHLAIEKNHLLNTYLKSSNMSFIFSLMSTHDNFSWGRFLFPIVPFLLKDTYIEIYNYNYLNSLKSNFNEKEFSEICKNLETNNPFNINEMHNPNFIKLG